jgi:hypothetical protein
VQFSHHHRHVLNFKWIDLSNIHVFFDTLVICCGQNFTCLVY